MTKRLSAILVALSILLAACGQLSGDVLTLRSADPALSLSVRLLPAPPIPPIEPSVLPTITPTALPVIQPPDCLIKVNKASNGEFIFHVPGSAAYNQTIIEPDKGEFYACDEQAAIDAGARKALR